MDNGVLSATFIDEARRIFRGGCPTIYPTYDVYKFLKPLAHMQSFYGLNEQLDAELRPFFSETELATGQTSKEALLKLFEHLLEQGQVFPDEASFLIDRNQQIEEIIEENCRPLAIAIMEQGLMTYWSNGYGPGKKGVWWENPSDPSQKFFTSLLNGKTYPVIDKSLHSSTAVNPDQEIDTQRTFGFTLPLECFPNNGFDKTAPLFQT